MRKFDYGKIPEPQGTFAKLSNKIFLVVALSAFHVAAKDIAREVNVATKTVDQYLLRARWVVGVETNDELRRMFLAEHHDGLGYLVASA